MLIGWVWGLINHLRHFFYFLFVIFEAHCSGSHRNTGRFMEKTPPSTLWSHPTPLQTNIKPPNYHLTEAWNYLKQLKFCRKKKIKRCKNCLILQWWRDSKLRREQWHFRDLWFLVCLDFMVNLVYIFYFFQSGYHRGNKGASESWRETPKTAKNVGKNILSSINGIHPQVQNTYMETFFQIINCTHCLFWMDWDFWISL